MQGRDRNVLKSWKEIAQYFEVATSTVQRWEKFEGLPVHRQEHQALSSVYAYVSELEAWRKSRSVITAPAPPREPDVETPQQPVETVVQPPPPPVERSTRRFWLGAGILGSASAALAWRTLRTGSTIKFRPVATGVAYQQFPTVSPDGSSVVFVERDPQRTALLIADIKSGAKRELLSLSKESAILHPRYSPDNQALAYLVLAGKGLWAVETLDLSTLKRSTITHIDGAGIAWAPDSQWLAVTSVPDEGGPVSAYAIRPSTLERRRLTSPPTGTWGDIDIAVSPDGDHFAVARYQTHGDGDLWLCTWDGRTSRRLTHLGSWIQGLTFTPDGRGLVYAPVVHSSRGPFFVSSFDGKPPRPVPNQTAITPIFCQIGGPKDHPVIACQSETLFSRIYFSKLRQAKPVDPQPLQPSLTSLHYPTLSPDASRIAWDQIGGVWLASTATRKPSLLAAMPGVKRDLRWSPDGAYLAVTSQQENAGTWVWIIDIRTGLFQRLTSDHASESRAIWSSDAKWIYWRSNRDGRNRFWRRPWPSGGSMEPVSPAATDGAPAANGRDFYFLDNDQRSPLHVCTIGAAEPPRVVDGVPPLKPDYWQIREDNIFYGDTNESQPSTSYYLQQLGSLERRLVAVVPVPTTHLHSVSVSADLSEIAWDTAENNSDIYILEDLL